MALKRRTRLVLLGTLLVAVVAAASLIAFASREASLSPDEQEIVIEAVVGSFKELKISCPPVNPIVIRVIGRYPAPSLLEQIEKRTGCSTNDPDPGPASRYLDIVRIERSEPDSAVVGLHAYFRLKRKWMWDLRDGDDVMQIELKRSDGRWHAVEVKLIWSS
jgi:hypothetical protein